MPRIVKAELRRDMLFVIVVKLLALTALYYFCFHHPHPKITPQQVSDHLLREIHHDGT